MSLHLDLFPLQRSRDLTEEQPVYAPTILHVPQCLPFFAQLADITAYGKEGGWGDQVVTPQQIFVGFRLTRPNVRKPFDTDNYGLALTWLWSHEFAKVDQSAWDMGLIDEIRFGIQARAALAYLAALPSHTPVILDWR